MTKNYLFALLFSAALSFVFCAAEIPLLKKLGAGQNILHYVKEHSKKSGTPTMGGLGFVLAAVLSSLVFAPQDKLLYSVIAIGLGYLLVGFLDDLLKKRRRENLGLRPYQKLLFQLAVAGIASVFCYVNGFTTLYVPFLNVALPIGAGIIPFGVIVFLATVNSVNLTDGLDGLAGSVSAVFFFFFALILLLQGRGGSLTVLSFCLCGALLSYLVFNTNKASVFMGDTGSLSLGGFAAALTLFTENELLLPVLGIMFVLSSITVILQVIYYKKTGKRIFLMAPVHHHFQEKGYSEGKITYAYALITALMGAILLLPLL